MNDDYTADIKDAVFDNLRFERWVEAQGDPEAALTELFEFKWTLTDQIRAHREVGSFREEGWEARITTLVIRIKQRIAQVKRSIRIDKGQEHLLAVIEDIREGRDTDD